MPRWVSSYSFVVLLCAQDTNVRMTSETTSDFCVSMHHFLFWTNNDNDA
jgi:hypothetical protein